MAGHHPQRKPDTMSIEERLRRFFAENPHEELSAEDAMAKLSRGTTVIATLGRLSAEGFLERVSVYRLRRPANR